MGTRIYGWVEGTIDDAGNRDEHSWRGIICLSSLIGVCGQGCAELFGLSKAQLSGMSEQSALFPNRGIPPLPSEELRRDLDDIRKFEATYGTASDFGYTYATWAELIAHRDRPSEDFEWRLLFDLMELLATDERFLPDRLRVVVWCSW